MKAKQLTRWFLKKNPYLTSGYIDENTKINKLLYFSNLYTYAILNEKIVSDKFIAFPNGPVVFDVYRDYRYNGLNHYFGKEIEIEDRYKKIIEIVNFVYGNKCKDDLVNISHSHNIWSDVKDRMGTNPEIIFENATPDLLQKCCEIYETYKNVNFEKLRKEVICENVYYYNVDDISELTNDMINKLMSIPKNEEAKFLEFCDGELILS